MSQPPKCPHCGKETIWNSDGSFCQACNSTFTPTRNYKGIAVGMIIGGVVAFSFPPAIPLGVCLIIYAIILLFSK